jgi:peptidoglycan/LPS O-acetylase OafA/YrhL
MKTFWPNLPRYPLARLLKRESNNLDLIRVLCACLVIFGHTALIVNDPRHPFGDPVSAWLNYNGVYSGSIAVRVFFFISGLLVTASLLEKRSPTGFLISRILRVWPALVVVLLCTVFVVGPLCSTYSAADYYTHPAIYRHLVDTLFLVTNNYLPGVFGSPVEPINAPLWTLNYEIGCYAALLGLFALKVTSRRWLCVMLVLLAAAEPLLPHSLFFPGLDDNPQVRYLPSAFALGALMALFRDRITLGLEAVVFSALIFLVLKTSVIGQHLFFVFLFLSVLYVSGLPLVRQLRPRADLSYGTYLWGFLVQHVVASQFAALGFGFNLAASLLISLSLAFLSWRLVEQPAIAAGRRWTKKLQAKRPRADLVRLTAVVPWRRFRGQESRSDASPQY